MSWDETTIGEALVFNYGKSLPDRERKAGEVTVYGSGGVVGLHNTALVTGPGIVVGRKGTIGATHWSQTDFFPIDTTYFITPKRGDVDLRYAYYLLKSLPLASMNSDAAVPGLNRENAYRLKIRLPKLETQQRITAILSAYDDLIENNQRRIALLEETARQLYKEWFVRFRFPGHERVKVVDGVPEGWERMPASTAISINPTTRRSSNREIRLVPMAALSEQLMCCDEKAFEYRAASTGVRFVNGDTLATAVFQEIDDGQ
ncbi:MAG: restriction endonuclease subunit S, partial [Polymorphobacter sp.]